MTIETIIVAAEMLIIVALVTNLVVRQVRGQYMDRRRLWGTPIILAAVGLVYLPFTVSAVVPADALLLGVELVLSVAVGLGLGALTRTRVTAAADRRGRRVQIFSGWRGGAVWIAFIAARLAVQPVASALHAYLSVSAGVVLILLSVARAVMAVVVSPRLDTATATAAPLDSV
ncbi:MAG: hypothetical protein EOP01_10015 [Propionibacteriaceae bacterium]|nr:MAG: hypothetical protein EOP01_10015 [Propionibacteriaceae bacterium]